MTLLFSFLEGLSSFISPCILPMLPMYLSYFSGSSNPDDRSTKKTMLHVVSFVLGFTVVLFTLGAVSGLVGKTLVNQIKSSTAINNITGSIVVILGLSYMGLFQIPLLHKFAGPQMKPEALNRLNLFTSFLFGAIFSIVWSPCVGVFLGSALSLSATSGAVLQGGIIMIFYSLGLGIPFLLSALLMDQLTSVFNFIKQHYRVITLISGGMLVITGLAMMTGMFQKLLAFLTF